MLTSTFHLTSENIESLLSLPLSDSTALLRQLPPEKQRSIIRQLGAAAGCHLRPEYKKIPLTPTPRQADFLNLTCREALYGGAAGGGKSESLLMWLAEGVHLPDYSSIIFRRTYKQLVKSNDSLWAKARRLFGPMGARGNKTDKQWIFPSGAIVEMGALEHEDSVDDYQGNSYHRAAYDEVTQFSLDQYEYITNSRIRKAPGYPVGLGVRCGANPGGIGHEWVKKRFITDAAIAATRHLRAKDPSPPGMIFFNGPNRAYVPARVADNPYLDLEDYVESLSQFTNPVTRERLMNGDWSVMPEGQIKPEWIRDYSMQGEMIRLHDATDKIVGVFHQNECRRFMTVDTAGSTKDKTRESKGKPHSWNVAGIWDYKYLGTMEALILRHVERRRCDFVEMCGLLEELHRDWQPSRIRVEDATMGPDLYSVLKNKIPIDLISTEGKGKVERATKLLNMLAKGWVFLPKSEAGWRHPLEAEWFSWQGLEDETNDQVDMAAYAAIEAGGGINGVVTLAVDPRRR